MPRITEIAPSIFYVGVNDRSKSLFEGLWPLPGGVSYNSYIVRDRKTALIDTVDAAFTERFLARIEAVLGDSPVDYLIINHMEPDHSASIGAIRERYPGIVLVGNGKTRAMLEGFYGIREGFCEIGENDMLPLGEMCLRFYMTPMVHWPETLMTYCPERGMLFSGDAFGCFGTVDGGVTDMVIETGRYRSEMFRYYSNIVGKYGSPVQNALKKLEGTEIGYLCPTHGPVWHRQVSEVLSIYDRLSRYEGEKGVTVVYGSMYGHTEQMAEIIAQRLSENGVKELVVHDTGKSDVSYILSDVFRYRGVIIGSPTYMNEVFPPVEILLSKIESRELQNRIFGCFGSFAWCGGAVKRLADFAQRMKWEAAAPPVEMKLGISPDKEAECAALADAMCKRMNELYE